MESAINDRISCFARIDRRRVNPDRIHDYSHIATSSKAADRDGDVCNYGGVCACDWPDCGRMVNRKLQLALHLLPECNSRVAADGCGLVWIESSTTAIAST